MYFAHWFAEMCNKHETTPTAVAIAVGVSPTSASYWLNGRNMPKKTTILKLEKYFGEKYEKEKSPASEDTELNESNYCVWN